MRYPDWYLAQLRDRLSIADYAGKRLSWDRRKSRPAQGDYWAPCPFHHEKSASFHVREREGVFKCFGCQEGGDVITLCRKLEGLDFSEAVERLAAEAGLPPPETSDHDRARDDRRGRLLKILARAHAFFRAHLETPRGLAARAYLDARGAGPDVRARFGIGLAPDGWSTLFEALTREGLPFADLAAAGLVKEGTRGPIDIFRNRIMFPIADAQGRVIAFGGRALDPGDPAKYLNSPETDLFHKGRTLYRLKEARELLARTRGSGLIVAEGYFDVAAFERAGAGAVAPLGTAMTEDQLNLAWKAGGEPILCFDGDKAGVKAAERALMTALPHLGPGKTVRIVLLPEGQDPDDVFRRMGAEALLGLLDSAKPAVQALFEFELARRPLTTPEARADLKARLAAAAGQIGHEETKKQYGRALNDLLFAATARKRSPPSASERRPWQPGKDRQPPPAPASEALKALARLNASHERDDILRLVVEWPRLLDRGADLLARVHLADPDLDAIRHAILDIAAQSKPVDRDGVAHHLLKLGKAHAAARVQGWKRRGDQTARSAAEPSAEARDPERDIAFADIEAEWMAFLNLDVTQVQVQREVEEARNKDLDCDDDAFLAAWAAGRTKHVSEAQALARGRPDEVQEPDNRESPKDDPETRAA